MLQILIVHFESGEAHTERGQKNHGILEREILFIIHSHSQKKSNKVSSTLGPGDGPEDREALCSSLGYNPGNAPAERCVRNSFWTQSNALSFVNNIVQGSAYRKHKWCMMLLSFWFGLISNGISWSHWIIYQIVLHPKQLSKKKLFYTNPQRTGRSCS